MCRPIGWLHMHGMGRWAFMRRDVLLIGSSIRYRPRCQALTLHCIEVVLFLEPWCEVRTLQCRARFCGRKCKDFNSQCYMLRREEGPLMDEDLRKLREDAALDLSPSSPAVVQVSNSLSCILVC